MIAQVRGNTRHLSGIIRVRVFQNRIPTSKPQHSLSTHGSFRNTFSSKPFSKSMFFLTLCTPTLAERDASLDREANQPSPLMQSNILGELDESIEQSEYSRSTPDFPRTRTLHFPRRVRYFFSSAVSQFGTRTKMIFPLQTPNSRLQTLFALALALYPTS